MNKKRYQEIIYEAHEKWIDENWNKRIYPNINGKEEFINKIKTNPKFSKKWGLKIEERDLSFKERRDLAHEYAVSHNKLPLCIDAYGHKGIPKYHEVINKTGWNIPTKLIAITYNNQTIEIYE